MVFSRLPDAPWPTVGTLPRRDGQRRLSLTPIEAVTRAHGPRHCSPAPPRQVGYRQTQRHKSRRSPPRPYTPTTPGRRRMLPLLRGSGGLAPLSPPLTPPPLRNPTADWMRHDRLSAAAEKAVPPQLRGPPAGGALRSGRLAPTGGRPKEALRSGPIQIVRATLKPSQRPPAAGSPPGPPSPWRPPEMPGDKLGGGTSSLRPLRGLRSSAPGSRRTGGTHQAIHPRAPLAWRG